MYATPAHRTSDARRATTDRRVVIAGPGGAIPESPETRHGGGKSVGRMQPIIGPGAAGQVRSRLSAERARRMPRRFDLCPADAHSTLRGWRPSTYPTTRGQPV